MKGAKALLIAIPSDAPGGLDAPISDHFGHCAAFTLVGVQDGEIGEVTVLENAGHEQGGCLAPVTLLKQQNVDTLVAGGMGQRPLAGFRQVDIAVHFKEGAASVREAVELFLDGKCRAFGEAQTCGGGGGHCGGHQTAPIEREPITGPADIRAGRVVSLDYELKDGEGILLDSSAQSGAMSYLHGSRNLVPGLEKELAGLEAGAHVVVKIPRGEGFGDRDESKIIEVPRAQLPAHAELGARVAAQDESGRQFSLTVLEIGDETARLDGNHPLAGKDLAFDVTVLRVEAATPEEIEAGHSH
jgi:FKBP-type peptidyl-prolyl cis-trans isomerase 2/predicted Fe-Mo cluster-binding NifX family protein